MIKIILRTNVHNDTLRERSVKEIMDTLDSFVMFCRYCIAIQVRRGRQ